MTNSWGKWGEGDEIGALNSICAQTTVNAAGLVREGRVISLAQPISPSMMIPHQRPGMMHFMNRDGGDYAGGLKARGGFQFADDTIVMPTHAGTHLDALCHCWYEDTIYNGFRATEVRSTGARRCGIHKTPPIVTRGVIIDVAGMIGHPLSDGFTIDAELLRRTMDWSGVALQKGDAVMIRTGWLERYIDLGSATFDTEPGIDVGAALLLAQAEVSLIGADNFAIETLPFPEGEIFPVHQVLIRDYGVPLLEGMVLKPLADAGVPTFLFVAAPLPIEGATASPINPVAIL